DLKPSPLLQQVLDTALGQLDDSARQRFSKLVAPPAPPPLPPAATPSDWILLASAESSADAVLSRASVDVQERFLMLAADSLGFRPAPVNGQAVNVPDFRGDLSNDED